MPFDTALLTDGYLRLGLVVLVILRPASRWIDRRRARRRVRESVDPSGA